VPASTPTAPADPVREILKVALGRQYEIQHLLGRGGMGAVYLATEAALEREVAIKVLPPDRGATQESRDRFRREARTAARLSHPNIVPLYTFGDVDGTLYFVMGYIKGESLATRLKREGRIAVEESRRILVELCDALDYAHKLGVIHRDIKPDNVLIEEGTGRALLTDFGVAKALGAGQTLTEVGSVLGTPHYMSPEQAQGKADIDHRSDLYSLGVLGYAMFAGKLPFEGATPNEVMIQHITKDPPPLGSIAAGSPPAVAFALTRCLAKNRDERWRSAGHLKAAIVSSDAEETPDELEGLPRLFRIMVVVTYGLVVASCWWLGGGEAPKAFRAVLGGGAFYVLTFALVLGEQFRQLRKAGFEPSRLVWEMLKQPEGWGGWYPRRFRGAGDVWERLPRVLRLARSTLYLTLVATFPIFAFAAAPASRSTGHNDMAALVLVLPPMFLAALVFCSRWQKQARAHGLDPRTAARTLGVPTAKRSFWSRPEVAALLLPADSAQRLSSGPPLSAPELAQTIAELGRAQSSRSIEDNNAANLARALAVSIAALDAEIASLASNVDTAEGARLEGKLAALGSPPPGEDDARRQMRELLQKQFDLLKGFESRLEHLKGGRDKRFELLRALWRQSLDLRAVANDPSRQDRADASIRTLCAEINRHLDGAGHLTTSALSDAPTMERN